MTYKKLRQMRGQLESEILSVLSMIGITLLMREIADLGT